MYAATFEANSGQAQKVLENYVNSLGDWDQWLTYLTPESRDTYREYIKTGTNLQNHEGILCINEASLISARRLDGSYSFPTQAVEAVWYEITLNIDVLGSSSAYKEGLNQKVVCMSRINGAWFVEDMYPLLENENRGNHTLRVGWGFVNAGAEPSTIRVYYSGTVYTVPFDSFIKNVCQNEIGNMGYNFEAVKANAMAAKMAGWWAVRARYRESLNADIKYGDVAFVPNTAPNSTVVNAVNAINGWRCVSSAQTGGKAFFTAYNNNNPNATTQGYHGGQLYQNGSNYLANNQGKNWQDILHYYYDYSSNNNPNTGVVQIYNNYTKGNE